MAYRFLIFILHYLQISVQGDESSRLTDLRMYIILASQPHVLAQKIASSERWLNSALRIPDSHFSLPAHKCAGR